MTRTGAAGARRQSGSDTQSVSTPIGTAAYRSRTMFSPSEDGIR